jgi:hypothetical protein
MSIARKPKISISWLLCMHNDATKAAVTPICTEQTEMARGMAAAGPDGASGLER